MKNNLNILSFTKRFHSIIITTFKLVLVILDEKNGTQGNLNRNDNQQKVMCLHSLKALWLCGVYVCNEWTKWKKCNACKTSISNYACDHR